MFENSQKAVTIFPACSSFRKTVLDLRYLYELEIEAATQNFALNSS